MADGAGAARILLVDNDADVSAILTQCIEMRGHVCELAADGQEGLERVQRALESDAADVASAAAAIDVVLLDLRMPRLGGRELLAQLRPWLEERSACARAPRFIVVSGFISQEDRDFLEGEELVAQIFKKPFDFVELLAAVDAELAKARSAERAAATTDARRELHPGLRPDGARPQGESAEREVEGFSWEG